MEIKTKFNIGDKVYYIDINSNGGIVLDKYIIDSLTIDKTFDDEIRVLYNIHNPQLPRDRHVADATKIYSLTDIDKILNIIKEASNKEEQII